MTSLPYLSFGEGKGKGQARTKKKNPSASRSWPRHTLLLVLLSDSCSLRNNSRWNPVQSDPAGASSRGKTPFYPQLLVGRPTWKRFSNFRVLLRYVSFAGIASVSVVYSRLNEVSGLILILRRLGCVTHKGNMNAKLQRTEAPPHDKVLTCRGKMFGKIRIYVI